MKKIIMFIVINALLVFVIAAIIIATWMPAIYTSEWFKKTFPHL